MTTAALTVLRATWIPFVCTCLALVPAVQASGADTPEAAVPRAQPSETMPVPAREVQSASPDSASPVEPSLMSLAEAGTPSSDGSSSAAASPIPYKQDDAVERTLGRLGWVLLLLAGLLGAVHYLQKSRSGKTGARFDRRLRVVETLRLSSRNALYLIEMDHRTLLLGMNGSEMKVLAAPPELPAAHLPTLNPDEDSQ